MRQATPGTARAPISPWLLPAKLAHVLPREQQDQDHNDERAQARLDEQRAKARQARQAPAGRAAGLLVVGAAAVVLVVAQNGPDEEAAR